MKNELLAITLEYRLPHALSFNRLSGGVCNCRDLCYLRAHAPGDLRSRLGVLFLPAFEGRPGLSRISEVAGAQCPGYAAPRIRSQPNPVYR